MTEPKWWDFTASKKEQWTREKVIEILQPLCDRFCVGDEVGDGGYEHLQGRAVFKVGKTLKTLKNMGLGWHWLPTHVRNFQYCEKEGDYYRSWEGAISKFANIELRPWQKAVVEEMTIQNDRQISVFYDKRGNRGKTTLAKYLVATHKAEYVPPMTEALDFMAFALEKPAKAYVFDIPRCDTIKQKKGIWSAIEQIKNGYIYDKRYSFRDAWIDPPKIIVFCNDLPDIFDLSRDRWRIYQMSKGLDGADWFYPLEITADGVKELDE